jgi:hypothetical protein
MLGRAYVRFVFNQFMGRYRRFARFLPDVRDNYVRSVFCEQLGHCAPVSAQIITDLLLEGYLVVFVSYKSNFV